LLFGLTLLALSFAATASAAVSARKVNEGGRELIVVANGEFQTFQVVEAAQVNQSRVGDRVAAEIEFAESFG